MQKMNNKGQMLMVGMLVLIMALLIFIATLPAIQSLIGDTKGCNGLNCAGYVDKDATSATCSGTNNSYDASLEENSLGCTVIDLTIPFLILAVLAGLIYKLIQGRVMEQPQPQYQAGY